MKPPKPLQDLIEYLPHWVGLEGSELERFKTLLPVVLTDGYAAAAKEVGLSPERIRQIFKRALRRMNNLEAIGRNAKRERDEALALRGHTLDLVSDLGVAHWRMIRDLNLKHIPKTWEELYYLWPRFPKSANKTKLAKRIAEVLGDDWNPLK